jgi:hypothetical protein
MKLTANRTEGRLFVGGVIFFPISNLVRTLKDGSRKSCEVVRTIPHGLPYDPMPFPAGLWHITGVEWQKDSGGKAVFDYNTYGPVKIRTDAWQWVKVWELDEEGDYLRERGDEVMDYGYLLHYSVFNTTLGCIKLASPKDAELLAKIIEEFLGSGKPVELEVV